METRLLEYFLTVARERNITKSAELLHITQPTLSRQLVQLEDIMGQQLLIRDKKGLQLTEAGIMLQRRAEEIISLIEKTERELKEDEDQLVGQLAIGTGETAVSFDFLPKVIEDYHAKYPQVTYELYTGNALLIKEKINQGLLDVGILLGAIDIESFDFIRLPYQDPWGLIVPINHSLAQKKFIEPNDLIGIPLFFNEKRSLVKNELKEWSKGNYDQYQIIGGHNLISNILAMVRHGIGCVISIEGSILHQDMSELKFIPLKPLITQGSVLVWKKNRIMSPITKKFIDLVKEKIIELEEI